MGYCDTWNLTLLTPGSHSHHAHPDQKHFYQAVTSSPIPEVMVRGKNQQPLYQEAEGSRFWWGGGFPRHPPIPLPPPPPSSFIPPLPGLCPHHNRPYFMTSQDTQLLFKVLIWEAYGDGCSLPWSVPFLTNGFSSPYI